MDIKKIQCNIIGPYFGQSGYDSHVRGLSNALNKLIDVCVVTQRPADWLRHVSDIELKMLSRDSNKSEINIMIGLPPAWPLLMCEDKKFVGFVVWEGDICPVGWKEILEDERVTQIWCPSKHTKNAILKLTNKVEDKLRIIPHGVDTTLFYPNKISHEKFTFLIDKGWVHSWRDRGGVSYAIKAFAEEFTADDDVKMIVKINSCYGGDLKKNVEELNIQNPNKPDLQFIPQQVEFKDLNKIYNESDVFICTSLAESFHLGCLQAQACGLPVITTTFGGQSDFCNEETGWLLSEGEMKENKWDVNYESVSWKIPDTEEIRKALRYCFEHQQEVKEKGLKALENSKEWTWGWSASKAKIALDKI